MVDFNSAYRFISVGALSLPVLWGIIYYMVESQTDSLLSRVKTLEAYAAKGERFTRGDGDRLSKYIEKHGDEIAEIHLRKAKIRETIAEVRVMQHNVLYRVQRIEDAIYDHEHRQHDGTAPHLHPRRNSPKDSKSHFNFEYFDPLCRDIPCIGKSRSGRL